MSAAVAVTASAASAARLAGGAGPARLPAAAAALSQALRAPGRRRTAPAPALAPRHLWRRDAAGGSALPPGGASSSRREYHVAVVGSGPSAFYTTKYLFKKASAVPGPMRIDMFERLPTPFGLVRFGVAPDHPEVKNVINDFGEVADSEDFRFFGNVEVGSHVPLATLRQHYDAVIVCTGAEGDRRLGVPGEDLQGVLGAPAFVKWYNGHPDFVGLNPRSPGEAVAVVGQGNVALDVARIIARSPEELRATDIDAKALDRIAQWQRDGLRTVHVIGRRGFVQAAFTNKELRELDSYDEVLAVVDPAELELSLNAASEEELAKSRMKKRSRDILDKMAANFAQKDSTSKRVVCVRFLRSPLEVLPDGGAEGVGGLRTVRTELRGAAGAQSAAIAEGAATEDIPCGLIVRSVGFGLTPLPGLPTVAGGRVPHTQGRVEDPDGGLYVSGWLKRGPTGIIAANIPDAQETAARVFADLQAREGPEKEDPTAAVEAAIHAAGGGHRVVSFQDWRKIEAEEQRRGAAAGRSAEKLTDVAEMLRLL